jgi:hypothetical protein
MALSAGLLLTEESSAQATRHKLWAEAGVGTGGVFFNCSACESPIRSFGEDFHIRGGVQLSDRVLLGMELHSLLSKTFQPTGGNEVSEIKVTSVSPVIIWYPWRYGLFMKGGFGISTGDIQSAATEETPAIQVSGTGSEMNFGVGLDVPVHRWIALTVNAGIYFSAIGDVRVGAEVIDDLISTSYNLSIGLAIR